MLFICAKMSELVNGTVLKTLVDIFHIICYNIWVRTYSYPTHCGMAKLVDAPDFDSGG